VYIHIQSLSFDPNNACIPTGSRVFYGMLQGSHFGNPGQPLAEEATDWLSKLILNKTVTITLLTRDQYGRAVCILHETTLFSPSSGVPSYCLRHPANYD
jgi:hypothetical protein